MNRVRNRLLASLLAGALLAFPGGAWAADPDVPVDERSAGQLAELKITREEAIAIAKAAVPIPDDMGEPNASISQYEDGATWSLWWGTSEKEPEQLVITVDVNAVNGRIVGYSLRSTRQEQAALRYTIEEALAIAAEWVDKLVPADLRPSLRYVDSPVNASYWGGIQYRFNWERMEQGYPVADDGVTVAIDARTGELVDYYLTWRDNLTFTLPERILPKEEAEAALREYLGMTLQYSYYTERGLDEGEWRLVYRPRNLGIYVNQEGQVVYGDGNPVEPLPEPVLLDPADVPYQKPAAPIGQREALAIAQTATGQTTPPTSASFSEMGTDVKTYEWYFTWSLEDEEGNYAGDISATIDASTGVLVYMGIWDRVEPMKEEEEPAVSREEAEAAAIEFVRKFRPDLSGRILYLPEDEDAVRPLDSGMEFYSFQFEQLVNGVPVNGRQLWVEVDARTGKVTYFSAFDRWGADDEFPAIGTVIGADQALDTYLTTMEIQPTWVTFWSYEKRGPLPPQLLWASGYRLPLDAVDAASGAPLDWEGRDLLAAALEPTDVDGHFAQREIELLWNRGVFELDNGKFHPDELATAEDLARWLVLAKGLRPYASADFGGMGAGDALEANLKRSPQSPYFGAAFKNRIMLPEDFPEDADLQGPVSRELFALWAARAMGYSRITTMAPRIEMSFADADQVGTKYYNAVALLAGFGILSGDEENRINPQAPITRGEAAKVLYAVTAEPREN